MASSGIAQRCGENAIAIIEMIGLSNIRSVHANHDKMKNATIVIRCDMEKEKWDDLCEWFGKGTRL